MAHIRALRGEPALRWPKWAAAKGPTKPLMQAALSLVAEAEAGEDIASHDKAPAADDHAVLVDGEDAGPEVRPGAAAEDAEMVGVFEVLRGSMKCERRQLWGTISAMPCHVHVANLGPRAIFAASLRSQLA